MKFGVTNTSAVSEPRTAGTTTTNFRRFCDDAAFGAHRIDGLRLGCWCVCEDWSKHKDENAKTVTAWSARRFIYMLALTFASFGALRPPVISVSVTDTSTTLIPSTSKSATADSAGFRELAALWARHLIAGGDS